MNRALVCVALIAAGGLPLSADTLRSAGVIGNSGEAGASLVRFGPKVASGMGVVYDDQGSLWDRGGEGVLNRYAIDGRLLGSFAIPAVPGSVHAGDAIVRAGDTLLFKQGRKLYSLPISAAPGTAPTVLPVEATRLSLSSHGGWAAAALDKEVFFIGADGTTRKLVTLEANAEDVEIGPGNGVYVRAQGKVSRVDTDADGASSWPSPGDRLQWLDGHWFGVAWHGTIRRFDVNFMPDPGVVLGGASGSFIGYVEGNSELELGRGLAKINDNLYAVSGKDGILHLLQWNEADRRFTIIRRIGAVQSSTGLALDSAGRVWSGSGMWEWTDGPDAPKRHGVPAPDAPGLMGAAMLPGDVMIAPAVRWGQKSFYTGKLDGPVGSPGGVEGLPADGVACALVMREKRTVLLVVNRTGVGAAFFVSGAGRHEGPAGPVTLEASVPLKELTSLATTPAGTVLAAADGQLVEFSTDGAAWRETRRWNTWGQKPADRFGAKTFVATTANRIWVSDTDNHRVLCFDLSSGRPVVTAIFGETGRAGDSLTALASPQMITANGRRAVVFDAGNQRLMRLELSAN